MMLSATRRIVTTSTTCASKFKDASTVAKFSSATSTTLRCWRKTKNNSSPQRFYTSVSALAIAKRVERVLAAKTASGLSYDDLAQRLGVTNTYTAQLCLGQAKLSSEIAKRLTEALPSLDAEDLQEMQESFPMRSFDDAILKEPNVYRTYEAVTHYGEAIKCIINEQCGDGIMSAIDFYCDVGTTTGKQHGEKRVVITFNGKFLPFIEQKSQDNGVKSPRD